MRQLRLFQFRNSKKKKAAPEKKEVVPQSLPKELRVSHRVHRKRRSIESRRTVYQKSDEHRHNNEFATEFMTRYCLNCDFKVPEDEPIRIGYWFFRSEGYEMGDSFSNQRSLYFVIMGKRSHRTHCFDLLPHPKHPQLSFQG